MAHRKVFVGTYKQHDGIEVQIKRTTVARRSYTHAVIPYYTTKIVHAPATDPRYIGYTIPTEVPCEPWYSKARFCGSLERARKQLKPGWILTEVHEQQA
jgi:hypothetical protein